MVSAEASPGARQGRVPASRHWARAEPLPDRLIRTRRSPSHRLALRNLYILPTGFGWLWLTTCGVLYLLAVNAGSNGALLLAYGGVALFLLAPFLTQFNLQGLELSCGSPPLGFAAEPLAYPLQVHTELGRTALELRFRGQTLAWRGCVGPKTQELAVPWVPQQRGLAPPGRLRLESRAPLGLFVCWTLWEPQQPQLVAPARHPGPVAHLPLAEATGTAQMQPLADPSASEEWRELAPHRVEEGPGRLAWKHLARSGQRLSKRFDDPATAPQLLGPAAGIEREHALEHLTAALVELARQGRSYGLALDGQVIPPGHGAAQLERCLEALALALALAPGPPNPPRP